MPALVHRSLPARSLLLLLVVVALVMVDASPASAGTRTRRADIHKINHARHNHGRRAYRVRPGLNEVAQHWARWMARHHTLAHNPNLTSEVHGWSAVGENVGRGRTVKAVHKAFMHSPPHRANILSPTFRLVGVGTARSSDGRVYIDEVFKRAER